MLILGLRVLASWPANITATTIGHQGVDSPQRRGCVQRMEGSCSGGSKLEKSLTTQAGVTARTKDRSARQLTRESVTEGPGRSCEAAQPRPGGTYELNVHPTPPRPDGPVPMDAITPQVAPQTPVSGTVLADQEESTEASLSQYIVYGVMLGFIGAAALYQRAALLAPS